MPEAAAAPTDKQLGPTPASSTCSLCTTGYFKNAEWFCPVAATFELLT